MAILLIAKPFTILDRGRIRDPLFIAVTLSEAVGCINISKPDASLSGILVIGAAFVGDRLKMHVSMMPVR